MRGVTSVTAGAVGGGLALGLTWFLVKEPVYGSVLFWAVPVLMGFVATWINRYDGRQKFWPLVWQACIGFIFYGLGVLYFLLDGIICMVMALPLAFPFVMLGVKLGHWAFHGEEKVEQPPLFILILFLAGCVAGDVKLSNKESVSDYRSSIDIAASPSVVWDKVVHLDKLPPTADWVMNSGLARPIRCEIKDPRVGGLRNCTLSTGPLPERITAWEPGRRLGFVSLSTPPPMKEINPFGETDAAHLHGYYRVLYAEFTLEPLPNGGTRLTRLTRYANKVRPFVYWDAICNFGLAHGHRYVLDEVKRQAESSMQQSRTAMNRY